MKKLPILALLSFSIFFSHSTLALNLKTLYERLKFVDDNYEVVGTVCEQVAKLEIESEIDTDQYYVELGIVYENSQSVLGELDVVVFRKYDHEAVLISEVKCWKKLRSARKKASDQLNRFRRTIQSDQNITLYSSANRNRFYKKSQFDENPSLITISQNGGVNAGFDRELEQNLDELMQLRKHILRCQRYGECKSPYYRP